MGNIYSIQNALKYLGYDSSYSALEDDILNADRIILPGVGSYKKAMENIKAKKLNEVLQEAVVNKKIPILGICLGMQILGISGTEDGFSEGLGLFNGIVEKFSIADMKIPHIGFNEVVAPNYSILYKGINNHSDFYFIHSYRMKSEKTEGIANCNYGEDFVASFEDGNVFGTQFHPEKSQTNGLTLLKNFLSF